MSVGVVRELNDSWNKVAVRHSERVSAIPQVGDHGQQRIVRDCDDAVQFVAGETAFVWV